MIIRLTILLALAQTLVTGTCFAAPALAPIRVAGARLLAGDRPIVLRGINWGWWHLEGTRYAEADMRRQAEWGANVLRLTLWSREIEDTANPGRLLEKGVRDIDEVLIWAEKYGQYVILDMHGCPGRQAGFGPDDAARGIWTDAVAQRRYLLLWRALASRYRDRAVVAAYELMNEPDTLQTSPKELVDLQRRAIATIREVDAHKAIVVTGDHSSDARSLSAANLLEDKNLIYTIHFYECSAPVGAWSRNEAGGHGTKGTADWTFFDREVKVRPDDAALSILLRSADNAGAAWFDDVELVDADGKVAAAYSFDTGRDGFSPERDGKVAVLTYDAAVGHARPGSLKVAGTQSYNGWAGPQIMLPRCAATYRLRGWLRLEKATGSSYAAAAVFGTAFSTRERLAAALRPTVEFHRRHQVPILVGEFAMKRGAHGHQPQDTAWRIDLFEENGFSWTYWNYRETTSPQTMALQAQRRDGTDFPINEPLLSALKAGWAKNAGGLAHAGAADVSIADYGARADADAAANRAAIQRAIDAVAVQGGRVRVPAGRWRTGSLQLKSGVELHLERGATLLGSTNRVDYNENTVFPENAFSVAEEWSGGHLVWAYRAHDIAVTGEGVIDGNGPAFFGDCDEDSRFPWYKYGLKLHPTDTEWHRPGQMLAFYQVKSLRLEGVTLANPPSWTCHVRCCDGFVARGVKILADRTIANSDGFSIDCTRNALVEKCTIRTGDDSFAIRASCRHHAASNACENIVVRDCDVWSCCYGFRFGIGSGDLRKVRVENCRIHESVNAFGFTPSWLRDARGVQITDVTVRDSWTGEGFCPVEVDPGESKSCVRNIRFENCRFEALRPCWIAGNDCCDVDGFVFTNCTYRRIGKLKVRHHGKGADSLERARVFVRDNGRVKNLRQENCAPGPVRPGVLVLAFDDRDFGDWERALPLFAKYGAHATFFVSGEIGADVIGSVKRLVRAGHAVGLHGQHHCDAPAAIREKGYDWYRAAEIDHPRHQLDVSLLRTFAFAYPNNARSDETDQALLRDFRRLRAGVPGAAPYDPKGLKQAGRIPLHENDALFFPVDELKKHRVISGAIIGEAYHTKIDEVIKCLERAAKNHEVVEFTSHGIAPDAKGISMKTEWLEAILAKARDLGLEVLSFDELDCP